MEQRFVFLGSHEGLFKDPLPPRVYLRRDRAEIAAAVANPAKQVTWISFTPALTDILLEKTLDARIDLCGSRLITLTPPRSESIPALFGLFHPVFGLVEGFQSLPKEELVEAITREDAPSRFIGGSIDHTARTLTLLRGDITAVVGPFSLFKPSGDGNAPDFTRLGLTDYGRTISLGDYEASADGVLYEIDPAYRRSLTKWRRQSERTFGASLMRLRKQRELKRSDFEPVSSKEIARLERNEVVKPHAKTLDVIAGKLGVRADEIDSF